MTDLQEGHEILEHAAKLGPEVGMAYLAGRFESGTTSVTGFLKAVRSYTDPNTGELKGDTPRDIRLLAEAARESLIR